MSLSPDESEHLSLVLYIRGGVIRSAVLLTFFRSPRVAAISLQIQVLS
jgi:hypothetical protein